MSITIKLPGDAGVDGPQNTGVSIYMFLPAGIFNDHINIIVLAGSKNAHSEALFIVQISF